MSETQTYGTLVNVSLLAELTLDIFYEKMSRVKFAHITYVVPKLRDSVSYVLI